MNSKKTETKPKSDKVNERINWYPGHMVKALRGVQKKIKSVDLVLEIRDARVPLASGNQTFQNLLDGLEEAGLGFEDVVSANVYLRDLKDFQRMNKIFRQYFSSGPPVRTTIQQNSGYEKNNALEQISVIAARTK